MESGREIAFRILQAVEAGATWSRALTQAAPAAADGGRERRFAHELASGCVRWRDRLDWILAQCCTRPIAALDPEVRVLLRLGLYQTLDDSRVAEHAAVHATVELAKRRAPQGAGLVNAVLRAALRQRAAIRFPDRSRDPIAYLQAVHSHPAWIVERWLGRFGLAATEALCAYDNRRPELVLRANRRRTTAADLASTLVGSRVGTWSPDAVRCGTAAFAAVRRAVESGVASVQDESGMLVAPLLDVRPGERILDLAAAPGGKTCHLAELAGDAAEIWGFDRSVAKLARVRDNAARLGLQSLHLAVADARSLSVEPGDAVLLDAPCSGLGVLARRADLRWRKQPSDLPRLQALQLELLAAAAALVRPGGRLVYSVCSFEPEETQGVALRFAAGHPDFAPEPFHLPETLHGGPGILYFLPHDHGIDGGFAARWRRRD